MRNTSGSIDLRQSLSSDYSADMRNSKRHKEMWPSAVLLETARARALPCVGVEPARNPGASQAGCRITPAIAPDGKLLL
jgi:hypothetical protein